MTQLNKGLVVIDFTTQLTKCLIDLMLDIGHHHVLCSVKDVRYFLKLEDIKCASRGSPNGTNALLSSGHVQ